MRSIHRRMSYQKLNNEMQQNIFVKRIQYLKFNSKHPFNQKINKNCMESVLIYTLNYSTCKICEVDM